MSVIQSTLDEKSANIIKLDNQIECHKSNLNQLKIDFEKKMQLEISTIVQSTHSKNQLIQENEKSNQELMGLKNKLTQIKNNELAKLNNEQQIIEKQKQERNVEIMKLNDDLKENEKQRKLLEEEERKINEEKQKLQKV